MKELRTGALLKELCLYALFLFCLSAVTYRNKDPTSFQVNKTMRDLLVEGNSDTVGFNQVITNFQAITNKRIKGSTHYLGDKIEIDVLSERSFVGISLIFCPKICGQRGLADCLEMFENVRSQNVAEQLAKISL